ncbi:MAG: tetratricopeptide repeat protein [Acidobacteriia bacterium]|nr:tetratricopeptide repeat protein [Terriglobia bacterium]
MRAETRHQLKQDRFSRVTIDAAERTAHWTVEHQSKLIIAGIVVLVVAAAVLASWYYFNRQDQKASAALAQAVRTMDAPVRPAGVPAEPDTPSYASTQERATEAHKKFQAIVDQYPHTRSADFAGYFLGVNSANLGDNAAAEREFKAVAASRNQDLAALAKFALASVYRNTNRNKDAMDLYKQLADKPTRTVSKGTAQLELAETYQAAEQTDQARQLYQQIQKENPSSEAAQIAAQKLQEMK